MTERFISFFQITRGLIHISLVKGNLPRLLFLQSVADITSVYGGEVCPSFLDTWKTTLSSPSIPPDSSCQCNMIGGDVYHFWAKALKNLDNYCSNSGAMVEATYLKWCSYRMVWGWVLYLSAWGPEFHCATNTCILLILTKAAVWATSKS